MKPLFIMLLASALLISACSHANQPASPGLIADHILIIKSARTMTLLHNGAPIQIYKVALSRARIGRKEREGDHKVPEGQYLIDSKNSHSHFHLALHVSYPNSADRDRAHKLGAKPGGNIEIHGLENGFGWLGSLHRSINLTDGCIAVTDSEIDQIWPLVPVGTPVEIRP
jgi:murein L,D-transpeptidase YafK